MNVRHGYFLSDADDIESFDPLLFSINQKEVDSLDPQIKILLEVIYECMQNGGQTDWQGKSIGCFVGTWNDDWLEMYSKDPLRAGSYDQCRVPSKHDFALSNPISYEFDLKGSSATVKTACSSSLIALYQALRAIEAGDCESAIVAGENLMHSPSTFIGMSEIGVLSPDGTCKSFDASADGYARGEGHIFETPE